MKEIYIYIELYITDFLCIIGYIYFKIIYKVRRIY